MQRKDLRIMLVIMGISFIPMMSVAQVILSGKVIDKKTNEPIVGASVFVRKHQIGTSTNAEGLYQIKFPKKDVYLVEVSYLGYKTIKQNVSVDSDLNKTFYMEKSTKVLNEVVVKASSHLAEINQIRKSPMAVTVVDGAKLRGRSSGIEEVLNRTSGLKVRKSGGLGSASRISVHGLEGKRVAVYINGFPLNSPDGSFDINDMPIDIIKYIEVYKGIVPAEYGSDGLGGAINIVTREDDCDMVGFTQELASFGTSKTLISGQKLFTKPGILFNLAYFRNKSDNDYTMTWPVFETNLPASAYQTVRRHNDYYSSNFYHVGLQFTKLYFDKLEFECGIYDNKKGIQSLSFDSQNAHTHGTNIMPTFTLEKKDFLLKGLELKSSLVMPIINMHMVDTTRYRKQWDGTISQAMGETEENLYNNSDDHQFELRDKINLKYEIGRHTFNINNQLVYSDYKPKDDYMKSYLGFDPSSFPSKMTGNTLGLSHVYMTSDNRLQNSLMLSLYYLNSKIYRTSDKMTEDTPGGKIEPQVTKVNNFYYGFSEGVSYEFLQGIRGKVAFSHNVRIPDASELFGDGISIKPSVNLLPEIANNLSLGVIVDKEDILGMSRVQIESNFYYMYIKNMIRLFPAGLQSVYINLGKTSIIGFDTDLKVDVTPNIYSYFNITLQDIRDRMKWTSNDNTIENPTYKKNVPNIPDFYFNYGIEYHTEGLLGKSELSRVYLDASYIGEFNWSWQMSTLTEQRKKWVIPSSHIFTIGLQQSFWHNNISLGCEVENLFDKESYMEYKKPLQGRTFKVKLRFNLFRDKVSGGAMSL